VSLNIHLHLCFCHSFSISKTQPFSSLTILSYLLRKLQGSLLSHNPLPNYVAQLAFGTFHLPRPVATARNQQHSKHLEGPQVATEAELENSFKKLSNGAKETTKLAGEAQIVSDKPAQPINETATLLSTCRSIPLGNKMRFDNCCHFTYYDRPSLCSSVGGIDLDTRDLIITNEAAVVLESRTAIALPPQSFYPQNGRQSSKPLSQTRYYLHRIEYLTVPFKFSKPRLSLPFLCSVKEYIGLLHRHDSSSLLEPGLEITRCATALR
jgi:hypothetical protein